MDAASRWDAELEVLRQYYSEHDTFASIDGIFKIFGVIMCVVSSVLYLGAGACGSAQLTLGGGGAALASAFLVVTLIAASTCSLPTKAPLIWLYTDLVLTTVTAGVLLVSGVLVFTLCQIHTIVDYAYGPIAMVSAGLVQTSAVVAYSAVARRWDEALRRAPASSPPPPEVDV